MDLNRYRLKYVDADDLDDTPFDFDGMSVTNAQDEDLGDVDGFIVDAATGRPYYLVVDAGGWFRSKYYLLPVGHARFDEANERLTADLSRATIERFPGFDRDHFEKLPDADLDRFNEQTALACGESATAELGTGSGFDRWSHYRQPDWWTPSQVRSSTATAADIDVTNTRTRPARDVGRPAAEEVVAREDVAEGGETSPHPGGRAQPGDVIGVETGGEQTHVGETSEDENKRRRDAEKDAAKRSRD